MDCRIGAGGFVRAAINNRERPGHNRQCKLRKNPGRAAPQARFRLALMFMPGRRFAPEAPARQTCALLTTRISVWDPHRVFVSISSSMIRRRVLEVLLSM